MNAMTNTPLDSPSVFLSVQDVILAHSSVAGYFTQAGKGIGGVGVRDDGSVLHSAIGRQHTGFGGEYKWVTNLQVAATVLFGLLKNHPFLDGNKRTALLSVVYLLRKQGYKLTVKDEIFEDFVVNVAGGLYRNEEIYQYFLDEGDQEDADIKYIAYKLDQYTEDTHPVELDMEVLFDKYLPSLIRLADR